MRRALVVANGNPPSAEIVQPWVARADLIVAADGGAGKALALGIPPDAVVGDMDSVLGSMRRQLGRKVFHPRRSPYRTDLQKSVDYALERGCRDVTIIGATNGDRFDHILAAASLLVEFKDRARLRFVDDFFSAWRVERTARLRAPPGTIVSLLALPVAQGVTTSGLRWDLRNRRLAFGTLGIHNEIVRNPARVSVGAGDLIVFLGHRIYPHA